MNSAKVTVFLAFIGLAAASPDLDAALKLIECAQKAVINGIPEAGIPSHDPLRFPPNINFTLAGSTFEIDNLILSEVPWWNVTQADEIETGDDTLAVFNYTIYWKLLSLSSEWKHEREGEQQEGTFSLDLEHVDFKGIMNLTKPADGKNGVLNKFTLAITTQDAKVKITGLGLIGEIINAAAGEQVKYWVNNNPFASVLEKLVYSRFTNAWLNDHTIVNGIIANC